MEFSKDMEWCQPPKSFLGGEKNIQIYLHMIKWNPSSSGDPGLNVARECGCWHGMSRWVTTSFLLHRVWKYFGASLLAETHLLSLTKDSPLVGLSSHLWTCSFGPLHVANKWQGLAGLDRLPQPLATIARDKAPSKLPWLTNAVTHPNNTTGVRPFDTDNLSMASGNSFQFIGVCCACCSWLSLSMEWS